jgi:hypothetical protein
MANNLGSNVTRKVMRSFLKNFFPNQVISRTINTQLFQGAFNPTSGSTVDIKRPHDYTSYRSSDGDISTTGKSDIISGKATATVQEYFTVGLEWTNLQEAIELDQLDEIIAPAATRIVTDLETDLAAYMMKNCNLSYGTPGTAVDAWSHVSGANALLRATGVPQDSEYCYVMNDFTQVTLAGVQHGLSPGSSGIVDSAWERAQVTNNLAGMRVMASNALSNRNVVLAADKAGRLNAAPDVTYATAKDSMTQSLQIKELTAGAVIQAGDILEFSAKYRASGSTRLPVFDAAGDQVKFRATVTTPATVATTGIATVTVAGPGIYESSGAYNTTTAALAEDDIVTIIGTSGDTVQPALFYHPQAFALASVKLPKLYATDTVAVTEGGLSFRVTKYSDGDKNKQMCRIDFLPAYGTLNPFFAGQGFGV